jgi:sugar/nucleoside kinase (ribokinase family)
MSPQLTIVGGASLDVLHLRDGSRHPSAGGAGLYTALAAQRAGATVTMIAPRPAPMPRELEAAAIRLDWRGPEVPPADLPGFEIEYPPAGGTRYRRALPGAEARLSPDDVAWVEEGFVYLIPMLDAGRQRELLRHFKARGCRVACGTYAGAEQRHVREVARQADAFFCNEREATALFGTLEKAETGPGRILFVTRGSRGARVVQGGHATDIAGVPVEERDPTGAGDTFCGTTLARWLAGEHPVAAAEHGVAAAAEMVTAIGPAALLAPPPLPEYPRDDRIRLDADRIRALGEILRRMPELAPWDFTGPELPAPGAAGALACLFAATLQQFGFWELDGERFGAPMVAMRSGRELKGSDYLWSAYSGWLRDDPEALRPERQAELTAEELRARFRADDGSDPLPAAGLHLAQARQYGRDMVALGWTPEAIVARANAAPHPLAALLEQLDHVGGYKEDPLRKKSALLGLILRQRPEAFLRTVPDDGAPPVVDYHVQRSCLRLGLVRVGDEELRGRLASRRRVDAATERGVRAACCAAVRELCLASGREMGAVDWFLFQNRTRCPEMSEPDCERCPADPACLHARELFQPVFRTSFY